MTTVRVLKSCFNSSKLSNIATLVLAISISSVYSANMSDNIFIDNKMKQQQALDVANCSLIYTLIIKRVTIKTLLGNIITCARHNERYSITKFDLRTVFSRRE